MTSVRFVLVRPLYASNVGRAARAMRNFGFDDLRVVAPECDIRSIEATKYAMTARPLLESASICETIGAAVVGTDLIVATTRLGGKARPPLIPLSSLPDHLEGRACPAILFGSERGGLTPEELHDSHTAVTIPTVESRGGSINLGQAVAIVAYELARTTPVHTIASRRLAALEDYLDARLRERGFFSRSRHLPGPHHLRRMLRRMAPDANEADFLFALFRHLLERE